MARGWESGSARLTDAVGGRRARAIRHLHIVRLLGRLSCVGVVACAHPSWAGATQTPPAAVKNLTAWYDANDGATITLSGSAVTAWADRSGNGNGLTQSSSGSQPSYGSVGGLAAITFNGGQSLVSSTSNTFAVGSAASTIFAVAAYTGSSSDYAEIADYGAQGAAQARIVGKVSGSNASYASEFAADVDSTGIWSSSPALTYASFGTSTEAISFDGALTTQSGSFTPSTPAATPFYVGYYPYLSSFGWTGQIYEVIVYNGTLTTTEEQFIEGYLACKWNLQSSLPPSHPYASSCPSTATPALTVSLAENPTGTQPPGTVIAYTTTFVNNSGTLIYSPAVTSPIPANTWFQVGSTTQSIGSTGLSGTVTYSNDSGTSYTYTPTSGGGGAAAGYDANVTNVRWTFSGAIGPAPTINTGTTGYSVRII